MRKGGAQQRWVQQSRTAFRSEAPRSRTCTRRRGHLLSKPKRRGIRRLDRRLLFTAANLLKSSETQFADAPRLTQVIVGRIGDKS